MQDHRLYIVVRADLPAGLQAAQAVHAAFEFASQHRSVTEHWLASSNYLIIVAVPDEHALTGVIIDACARGISSTVVREPDIGDQLTAVALTPGEAARRLCANMPLALREPALTG